MRRLGAAAKAAAEQQKTTTAPAAVNPYAEGIRAILVGESLSGNAATDPITGALAGFLQAIVGLIGEGTQTAGTHVAGAAGLLGGSVAAVGGVIRDLLHASGLSEAAANIDTSGDLFALIGSIEDAITDERLLTEGPLTFQQVLEYENRISGLRIVVVIASFFFSLIVEAVTLGQLEGFIGLLIHLVDDAIGEKAAIVSTQLVRRAVGDPLADGYKFMHRTTQLAASDAVSAFTKGLIEEDELLEALAHDGFTDRAIQVKTSLARVARLEAVGEVATRTHKLTVAELTNLRKAGILDDAGVVKGLGVLGYDDDGVKAMASYIALKTASPPPGAV